MKALSKKTIILLSMLTIGFVSSGYIDSYFEISKNLDIFSSVYREVNVNYVEETNPGKLVKTGIDAMLGSLDPYTNYIAEADIEDYRFMTTHEYGGIGALIGTRNGQIMITEPYEDSPADKAGLEAGDVIIAVEDERAEGKSTSELSSMLKGESGTEVKLTVYRAATNEEIQTTIVREKIKLDDVPYYGMIDDEVGYINLRGFTQTASRDVKQAFDALKDEGMNKVILDLRGNGGGLLHEAVNIVNFFVPKGEKVVETKGKVKDHYSLHRALNAPLDLDIPLVVLIDEGSASASEIVSGTLQDLDRGVVIGQNSFGKGLVQNTTNLSYNSMLKMTIAKYYTPSGRCIQRIDYGKRDERGKAVEVPDSLTTNFTTKNGRIVKDGAGITPDIAIEIEAYSDLLATLMGENIVFDFATDYYFQHDSIDSPEKFALTDEEFEAFVGYALSKDFEYRTSSTEMMKELQEVIEEDEFWEEVKGEYEHLSAKLERDKRSDMFKFRHEIQIILENEIVGRYYFSKGRVRAYMKYDPEVLKALETLRNKEFYTSVLEGTCAECLTKKG
ncbi:MAG: S41 family peptidase [Flavobacteriales bacterium]|nr:S41 family peptidase [Flavobacteriales bacterium]